MHTARIATASSIGLLLCLCGCNHYAHSPYGSPYGGYGPGMYPAAPSGGYGASSYPAAPSGGYMNSSPTYVPYTTPSGPSPTPLPNGGTSPGQPTWQTPGGNPAPSYDGTSGGTDKPVPTYPDEDNKPFGGGAPSGASLFPGTSPAAGNLSGSGIQLQPIETSPTFPSGAAAPPATIAVSDDPFESPVKATSGGTNVTARSASLGQAESRPNPFAHDARNFTWLRGIVDYDSQDQRWVIIYSADPDSADRYGGSITLSDHPLLQRIKPGDVVLVEGAVDEVSFDHHGKPIYKISKLQPLKPKH